jgi:beta-glucanase (GH16 family)
MNKIRLILYKFNLLRKRKINKPYKEIKGFRYGYPWGRSLLHQEQQYYSDDNVSEFDNGFDFFIKKEDVKHKAWWTDDKLVEFNYTSGMLFSNEKFLYGSFEADIFIPSGYGLWSAFWLVGFKKKERFGEIDIFEYYGSDKSFTYNTHWGKDYDHNLSPGCNGIKLPNLENSWHKYRADWTKKDIRIYIDDYLVGVRDSEGLDIPMNLIINMAIKKNIGDKLDKNLPTIMQVKNIKYYPYGGN